MKHIMIIFVLLMAVATQAVAVETTMVCDARGGETRYYKYVSPFLEGRVLNKKLMINGVIGVGLLTAKKTM